MGAKVVLLLPIFILFGCASKQAEEEPPPKPF